MIVSMSRAAGLTMLLALLLFFSPGYSKDAPKTLAAIDSALASRPKLAGKVVLVDFWASWCVPCRISFPWMKSMAERYGAKGFEVVAISVDKDHESAMQFLNEARVPFTVIYDSTGALAKRCALDAMPTSFLYARDGTLRSTHDGFHAVDTADYETQIASCLREKLDK